MTSDGTALVVTELPLVGASVELPAITKDLACRASIKTIRRPEVILAMVSGAVDTDGVKKE